MLQKAAFRPASEPILGAPCLASETRDERSAVILTAAKDLRISPTSRKTPCHPKVLYQGTLSAVPKNIPSIGLQPLKHRCRCREQSRRQQRLPPPPRNAASIADNKPRREQGVEPPEIYLKKRGLQARVVKKAAPPIQASSDLGRGDEKSAVILSAAKDPENHGSTMNRRKKCKQSCHSRWPRHPAKVKSLP